MGAMEAAVAAFFQGSTWVGNPKVTRKEDWFVLWFNGVPMARRCEKHVEITAAGLPFRDDVKELIHTVIVYNGDMRLERTMDKHGTVCWTIRQGPRGKELHADLEFDPNDKGWTMISAGSVFEQLGAIEDSPDDLPEADETPLDFF